MRGDGRRRGEEAEESAAVPVPSECGAVHGALSACHRRVRDATQRAVLCRHLNRALAECVVAACCPAEAEAVRSLCRSSGTALKRSQCQGAQLALSACLAAHQHQ